MAGGSHGGTSGARSPAAGEREPNPGGTPDCKGVQSSYGRSVDHLNLCAYR